jgi:hypothetical protein
MPKRYCWYINTLRYIFVKQILNVNFFLDIHSIQVFILVHLVQVSAVSKEPLATAPIQQRRNLWCFEGKRLLSLVEAPA